MRPDDWLRSAAVNRLSAACTNATGPTAASASVRREVLVASERWLSDEECRAIKLSFIPSSSETKEYADARDLPRELARNQLIQRNLAQRAMQATTLEALKLVVAAIALVKIRE